ncbi:MAG TPA: DUF4301 family protein, partial [Bacteroidales bacterium]|nr:DUF4301 family protein [Bacteroidales bacterium]
GPVMKFVPASGAASRMFKHLFEFREDIRKGTASLADHSFNSVWYFLQHLEELPFYGDLLPVPLLKRIPPEQLVRENRPGPVIDAILGAGGLNYGNLPKALLKFHRYPEGSRTALEEHLVEAAHYAADERGTARIHFTLSPEHTLKFSEKTDEVRSRYEKAFGVTFEIGYSVQKESTDTLAVDEENHPFRKEDGTLLFRPAGHGALLANLEETDAGVIFIKNIDNIVPDRLKGPTYENKKLIGGVLLRTRDRIHSFLRKETAGEAAPAEMAEIVRFISEEGMLPLPEGFDALPEPNKREQLRVLLNRPIRVCGMVKNEGEPGGGPFWVTGKDGRNSLQIVESSQVNLAEEGQKNIFSRATHFNPVDLVCSIRDFRGNKFRLSDWVDEETGFISGKSSGGRTLKAQELPGLWNGAMAKWITLFVEVPILTFNPVKTVNDLLRKEHQ